MSRKSDTNPARLNEAASRRQHDLPGQPSHSAADVTARESREPQAIEKLAERLESAGKIDLLAERFLETAASRFAPSASAHGGPRPAKEQIAGLIRHLLRWPTSPSESQLSEAVSGLRLWLGREGATLALDIMAEHLQTAALDAFKSQPPALQQALSALHRATSAARAKILLHSDNPAGSAATSAPAVASSSQTANSTP